MRLAYYAGASTAAAAACLLKAFHQRPNFYSAAVYLSQSNACLLILTNLCLVLACGFMYALQRLLYGPLRPIEIEQLSEKAWYAVLDTLLAMPSFREDVGGWLLTMFVLLLAGKVWGWIGEGRVDVLEQQPPANPRLFHARLSTSLILSVLFDIYMLDYCVESVLADPRPGMMVIFTFEFAILSIFSAFTLFRYGLTVTEAIIVKKQTQQAIEDRKSEIRAERAAARQNETAESESATETTANDEPIEVDEQEVDVPGWEDKRRWLFMLEVFTDFIKLIIYIFFFAVSITFNGLPMHIMRDVYMTFASFSKRVTDYVAYRKATSDMNARYPDATTEEIRGDACIVCRESMVAWDSSTGDPQPQEPGEQAAAAPPPPPAARRRDEGLRAKKLPCGHILHLRCLKAWLERQQVCPTCRRPVVAETSPSTAPAPGAAGPQGDQEQPRPPQQPPRPNRARIFNLGPIRVGLLNAPNNQLQNIVDQLRNPEVANRDAAAQGGARGGRGGSRARRPEAIGSRGNSHRSRAGLPTQIQLMQMEQRLMQEAHNLGIEQQQLATLRMMEAELSRLRAHHIPHQPPVGIQTLPQPANPVHGTEILEGNPSQQLGNGHENLPPGLVLPEGWTVTPLEQVARYGSQANLLTQVAPDQQTPAHSSQIPPPAQPAAESAMSMDPVSAIARTVAPVPEQAAAQQAPATNAGPTDDSGSPLFLPSSTPAEAPAASDEESSDTNDGSHTDATEAPKAPWTPNGDWSFANQTEQSSSTHEEHATTSNGGLLGTQAEHHRSDSGKGKGRAVEVEDVPDPDAGS